MERLNSIQVLRGLAALLVVFHHLMQQFYGFAETNVLGDFFSYFGNFGVDVFFVISGFIMAYSLLSKDKSATEFAKSRLYRIVPPYYLYTLLIIILGIIFKDISSSNATFESVLKSLLFIPHENPDPALDTFPTLSVGWTLNLEMFFYFFLSFVLLIRTSLVKKLTFVTIFLVFSPLFYRLLPIDFYKYVLGNIRLLEFAEGIILGMLFIMHSKLFHNSKVICLALILLVSLSFINAPEIIKDVFISGLVVYLMLVYRTIFQRENIFNKTLIYFGKISYSMYLAHPIAIITIWSFYPILNSAVEVFVVFSLVVLLTILMADFTYRHIEIKFSRYLFSFSRTSVLKPSKNS